MALAIAEAGKHPTPPVNAKPALCNSLNGIPEHGRKKAEAKAHILGAVQRMKADIPGTAPSVVMEDFAVMYRKRQAAMPDWVHEAIPHLSRPTLLNWEKQLEQGGVRRFAKVHEKRPPCSVLNTHEGLQTLLVGTLEAHPYISAVELCKLATDNFGPHGKTPDPALVIPVPRRFQVWLKGWKKDNAQLFAHIQSPDAWRSHHKVAFGDAAAHVLRLNQEWQADSTKCDLILSDGQRHIIVGIVDVYSRRLRFHVSRTSSAAAVASCLRKAILDWGLPETLKHDNGSDYVSQHMQRVLATLEIYPHVCPPFKPEAKPYIERAFKTLLHSIVPTMPGYVGHNVAERKGIESRKSFAALLGNGAQDKDKQIELALSPEELQRFLDDYSLARYGNEPHRGIDGVTPNAKAAAYEGEVRRVSDERALDTLLLPVPGGDGLRVVAKTGIRITGDICGLKIKGTYIGPDVAALQGRTVLVRFDDTCSGRVLLFNPNNNEYLGKGENPGLLGWTPEQVRQVAIAAERQQKAFISHERKKTRAAAKAVEGLADITLTAALARHNAQAPAAAEQVITYTTPALEQAARARTGDFTPPTAEEHAVAMAELERFMTPEEPKGFVVPEGIGDKLSFWRALYDRRAAGEALGEEEEYWFMSFGRTDVCREYCGIHGLKAVAYTKPAADTAGFKTSRSSGEARR